MGDASAQTGRSRPPSSGGSDIDALMDEAQEALENTSYFVAVALAEEALHLARRSNDFARMARICMPLLEGQRQIRQLATDAGSVFLARSAEEVPRPIAPGCYLVQPPLIGMDGRRLREVACEHEIPVFVLTREPLTNAGLWPIVGVGKEVTRVRLDPPEPLEVVKGTPSRDAWDKAPHARWFVNAAERLGDQAIADAEAVAEGDPAAYLVDDLLDRLPGAPEHEKLHQRLMRACQEAAGEPLPKTPRRRSVVDDPFSF